MSEDLPDELVPSRMLTGFSAIMPVSCQVLKWVSLNEVNMVLKFYDGFLSILSDSALTARIPVFYSDQAVSRL